MLRMTRKATIESFAKQIENNTFPKDSEDINLFDGIDTPATLYLQYLKTKKSHLLPQDIDLLLASYRPNINYVLLGIAKLGDLTLINAVLRKHGGNLAYAMRGIAMFQPQLLEVFIKQYFSPAFPMPDAVTRELLIGAAFRQDKRELQHWFTLANVKNDSRYKTWMLNAALEGAGIRGNEGFIYTLHYQGGQMEYAVRGLALNDNDALLDSFLSENYDNYLPYVLQGTAISNDGKMLSQLMSSRQNSMAVIMFGAGLGGQNLILQHLISFKHLHAYAVLGAMIGGHYPMVNAIMNEADPAALPNLYRSIAKGALEYGLENKKIATYMINAIQKTHQLGVMQAINDALPQRSAQPTAQLFHARVTSIAQRQARASSVTLYRVLSFIATSLSVMLMIFVLPLTCCIKPLIHSTNRTLAR